MEQLEEGEAALGRWGERDSSPQIVQTLPELLCLPLCSRKALALLLVVSYEASFFKASQRLEQQEKKILCLWGLLPLLLLPSFWPYLANTAKREDGDDTHLLCCSVLGNSCCVMCTSAPATAFQREVIFLPFLTSLVCHKFKLADLITKICHGRLGYRREKGDLTELTMELMNANN